MSRSMPRPRTKAKTVFAARLLALAVAIWGGASAFSPAMSDTGPRPGDRELRVLVVGDSLAQGYGVGLGWLTRPGAGEVRRAVIEPLVHVGDGVIPRAGRDFAALVEARLSVEPAVDAVVFALGINDVGMPLGGGTFYAEDWRRRYREKVAALAAVPAARGIATLWIGLPATDNPRFTEIIDRHIAPLHDAAVAETPGARFVSIRELTLTDGVFASHGRSADGSRHRLRTADGIHFTAAGYRVMAGFILGVLEDELGRSLGPGPVPVDDASLTIVCPEC